MSTKRYAKSPPQTRKSQNPDHQTGCARGPLGPPAQPASLPLIPALNLKATLAQTTQNQPSSPLIIMKKSPAIIVTGNNSNGLRVAGKESLPRTTAVIRAAKAKIACEGI